MSQECYDKLVAELRHMEQVELPQVRDAIAEARDKGDLSENFEYHAAKREQGRLLGRISYKQKVLENARVIDKTRLKADVVGILSKVKIVDLSADFRIKDVATYEKWYKIEHKSPQFIDEAVYGLCEINRDKVTKETRLVANPGCYTTCSSWCAPY